MNSWIMHTMIPDMREREWKREVKINQCDNEKPKKINSKLLSKRLHDDYGLQLKQKKREITLILANGDFYHHIKEIDQNHKIYYFNKLLIEDVVGNNEHDIYGYVIEFLAYGFYEKTIRHAIINSGKINTLFVADSEKTFRQDLRTIHQFKKIFHNVY